MTDAKTYLIDIDTSREAGKKIILDNLFRCVVSRDELPSTKRIVESLTGIVTAGHSATPEMKKLAGRVRSWLRQLAAEGVLGSNGYGGFKNVTPKSRNEAKRRDAKEDRVESQAKADREQLGDLLGSHVKGARDGDDTILTPAQLSTLVGMLPVPVVIDE